MQDRAKRIRIRLYGQHLAYISSDLYSKFLRECNILDYSVWLKRRAKKDFDLMIDGEDAIEKLREIIKDYYFEDISDWLREKMRVEINKKI